MKKPLLFLFTTAFCLISYDVFTNRGGPTTGVAGDPPLNETCNANGCHNGSALNSGGGTASIVMKDSLNNTVTSYDPNKTYTVKLSISEGTKTRYGFESIILKGTGTSADVIGSIILTDTITQLFGGSWKWIMHKRSGIDFTTTTGNWSFKWKAPDANYGVATVYAAFNAADKNDQASGDKIYTKTLSIPGNGPLTGILSHTSTEFNLFPNPAQNEITLQYPGILGVEIFSLSGQPVLSEEYHTNTQTLSLESLSAGVYLMRVNTTDGVKNTRFVKQ